MYITKIVNPKSGRVNTVRAWEIQPREVLKQMKEGRISTARDLGLQLLSDREAIKTMEAEADGDTARTNFALAVIEQALDWRLGLAVIELIFAVLRQYRRLPKPFKVAVNRDGDVFILLPSGKVIVQ